jgi:hypothetical protein
VRAASSPAAGLLAGGGPAGLEFGDLLREPLRPVLSELLALRLQRGDPLAAPSSPVSASASAGERLERGTPAGPRAHRAFATACRVASRRIEIRSCAERAAWEAVAQPLALVAARREGQAPPAPAAGAACSSRSSARERRRRPALCRGQRRNRFARRVARQRPSSASIGLALEPLVRSAASAWRLRGLSRDAASRSTSSARSEVLRACDRA